MKWLLSFAILFILTTPVFAEGFNAGVVQGLWYSQETIFAKQTVRIYVAVRNNTGSDLTGTVEFFDNEKRIDKVSISALDGRIIERWADWTPSYGEHTITALLTKTQLHTAGGESKIVIVKATLAEDTFFVDYDTDGDGVGNAADIDDDGDGISDETEEKNGTDPLLYDVSTPEQADLQNTDNSTEFSAANTNTESSEGIEQYLTPSRADTLLANITTLVADSKEKLDTYRQSRAEDNGTAEVVPLEDIAVNADGFGEISRSTYQKELSLETPKPAPQKPEGFFGDAVTFIGVIFSGIYTGILATLSFILGYPILMQLSLLLGILFTLFKIAQKVARRPQ
jgi:hypothetical protein